ncbi:MAG: hypothetical protein VKM97_07830 [Cyanobacteriota bacterium]|nr:hypothetical protein [Cyanobacteriota bacterium]
MGEEKRMETRKSKAPFQIAQGKIAHPMRLPLPTFAHLKNNTIKVTNSIAINAIPLLSAKRITHPFTMAAGVRLRYQEMRHIRPNFYPEKLHFFSIA